MKTEKFNIAIIDSRTFDDYGLLCCMSNNQAYIFGESCTEARDLKEDGSVRDFSIMTERM